MTRKYIPVEEAFKEWRKDPEYVAAYDALEDEFALASALIRARGAARMSQEQLAAAMGTTQAVIAGLEGGRIKPHDTHLGAVRQGHAHPPTHQFRTGRRRARSRPGIEARFGCLVSGTI